MMKKKVGLKIIQDIQNGINLVFWAIFGIKMPKIRLISHL